MEGTMIGTVSGEGNSPDTLLVVLDHVFDSSDAIEAKVVVPFATDCGGVFSLPKADDKVLVLQVGTQWFVLGSLYGAPLPSSDAEVKEAAKQKRIRSKEGMQLIWDDSDGATKFSVSSANGKNHVIVEPEAKASIRITVGSGDLILEADKNITIAGDDVSLTAKRDLKVKGSSAVGLLAKAALQITSNGPAQLGMPKIGGAPKPPSKHGFSFDGSTSDSSTSGDTGGGTSKKRSTASLPASGGTSGDAGDRADAGAYSSPKETNGSAAPDAPGPSGNKLKEKLKAFAKRLPMKIATTLVQEGIKYVISSPAGNIEGAKVEIRDEATGEVVAEAPLTPDGQGNVTGEVVAPATEDPTKVEVVDGQGNVIATQPGGHRAVEGTVSPSTTIGDAKKPLPESAAEAERNRRNMGVERAKLDAADAAARGNLQPAKDMVAGDLRGAAAGVVVPAAAVAASLPNQSRASAKLDAAKSELTPDIPGQQEVRDAQSAKREVQQDIASKRQEVDRVASTPERQSRAVQADADRAGRDARDMANPNAIDPTGQVYESRATIEQGVDGAAKDLSPNVQVPNDPFIDAEVQANRGSADIKREAAAIGADEQRLAQSGSDEVSDTKNNADEKLADALKDELDDQA